jgi:hypothetical protein
MPPWSTLRTCHPAATAPLLLLLQQQLVEVVAMESSMVVEAAAGPTQQVAGQTWQLLGVLLVMLHCSCCWEHASYSSSALEQPGSPVATLQLLTQPPGSTTAAPHQSKGRAVEAQTCWDWSKVSDG